MFADMVTEYPVLLVEVHRKLHVRLHDYCNQRR